MSIESETARAVQTDPDVWTCPGGSEHARDTECDGLCAVDALINTVCSDFHDVRATLAELEDEFRRVRQALRDGGGDR